MNKEVDAKRLYLPGLAGLYEKFSPYSYALIRFAAGGVLVPHGIEKIVHNRAQGLATSIANHHLPAPLLLAWLAIFAESIAAVCVAIGLFTRLAALTILIEMTVIIAVFQWEFGYFWTSRGIEFALLWWAILLAIFFRGGGEHSVDARLRKEF